MRIVHVVRQYAPSRGGLEDVVAHLAAEQVAAGDDVRVVTLDRLFGDRTRHLPPRERVDGIDVTRIPFAGSSRYPLAPHVLAQIGGANLVHVHAVDFFFDALAASHALHRRPLVATTHGGFFHTAAHAQLKRLFFRTVTRWSAAHYRALVACSASDAALFHSIAPHVETIENGVDVDKYFDAASRTAQRRLVTIGRFSVNKRLDRVLDALGVLVRADPAWHLDIIGVPSDWSAEHLAAAIAERALSAHVTCHVAASEAQIRTVLGGASLFVSASTHEGFGLVLVEAASAGLACVVEGNAAFAALAPRLPDVRLSNFGDSVAAANAILEAFDTLPSCGRPAVDLRVLAPFAWPNVAARYRAVYGRVLGTGASAAPVRALAG